MLANGHAAVTGEAFGRGGAPYNRQSGEPGNTPSPCSFGTFAGLKTDASARVVDSAGAPIPGPYATGTDMAGVTGGHYPAGGINLGPAMTFGYIAGRHAASVTE
jgi:hypothetical protein